MSYSIPDRRPRDPDEVYGWSRSHGSEIIEASDWDGPCIRCTACGRVDHADGLHEWDRSTSYDSLVPVCSVCECPASDRDVVKGGPCQQCFHAVAETGGDYCYTCEIALELDDVSGGPRLQRAWDALHAPQPSLYERIREIALALREIALARWRP